MIASHHLYKLEAILALPFLSSGTRVSFLFRNFIRASGAGARIKKLVGASPQVDTIALGLPRKFLRGIDSAKSIETSNVSLFAYKSSAVQIFGSAVKTGN
jgi:hypothetical protein